MECWDRIWLASVLGSSDAGGATIYWRSRWGAAQGYLARLNFGYDPKFQNHSEHIKVTARPGDYGDQESHNSGVVDAKAPGGYDGIGDRERALAQGVL